MIENPFSIFAPLEDRIRIAIFTKEDDIFSDVDAAKKLGTPCAAGLHQVHGNKTVLMNEPHDRNEQADGMLTTTSNLTLGTRWADCQNFVIYSPEKHIAGVLHVGWRGLIAGAIPAFCESIKENYDVRMKNAYIGAGPSLCKACAEFSNPEKELSAIDSRFIEGKHADLQSAATEAFFEEGIEPNHFERHPDCTCCSKELYWTYRGGDREAVLEGKINMLCCALQK